MWRPLHTSHHQEGLHHSTVNLQKGRIASAPLPHTPYFQLRLPIRAHAHRIWKLIYCKPVNDNHKCYFILSCKLHNIFLSVPTALYAFASFMNLFLSGPTALWKPASSMDLLLSDPTALWETSSPLCTSSCLALQLYESLPPLRISSCRTIQPYEKLRLLYVPLLVWPYSSMKACLL